MTGNNHMVSAFYWFFYFLVFVPCFINNKNGMVHGWMPALEISQHHHHRRHPKKNALRIPPSCCYSTTKETIMDDSSLDTTKTNVVAENESTLHDHSSSSASTTTTPYEVLYPDLFLHPEKEETPYDIPPRSLNHVLRLFQRALDKLSSFDGILRIEHQIGSQTVDPLAWLHAQQQHQPQSDGSGNEERLNHAAFYFCNGDLEVAVLGATRIANDTDEILRSSSSLRWYGGARFDPWIVQPHKNHQNNSNNMSVKMMIAEEWNSFGNAYWILPTLELSTSVTRQKRRRQQERSSTTATRSSTAAGGSNNNNNDNKVIKTTTTTTLAMHVQYSQLDRIARFLKTISDQQSSRYPPQLPPIVYRPYDRPEIYENAVQQALRRLHHDDNNNININNTTVDPLTKVVLAREQTLEFGVGLDVLDILRRWKYGGYDGTLFYLRPHSSSGPSSISSPPAFFGCTPERLFRVAPAADEDADSVVNRTTYLSTEALAGSRPRGSTKADDDDLFKELLQSPKDLAENRITGEYIENILEDLFHREWVTSHWKKEGNASATSESSLFVRRLLNIQHICQRYSVPVHPDRRVDVIRYLLRHLHPTPAVCGFPTDMARDFIRKYEHIGFDRGFYAGPLGYISNQEAEVVVAIRSGLAFMNHSDGRTTVKTYAGSGLVRGSTLSAEWAETNYKFAAVGNLFPQSPMTLRNAISPNVAFATAFVEELIRNGITKFYVCPGSRSTPLVAALARAVRANVGVIHAESVHDERAAGFRALGYARGSSGRPAVVITSSGTAVANLYPAVVEAGMDGVPMVLVTADRPYENRGTGANQAIDQVKLFSDTYVRWFRDILPPSDDMPVSVTLADAEHAVFVAKNSRGPVHLNVQFRENLAPDAGPIRNDRRKGSFTRFDGIRFIDAPKFHRWSRSGKKWTTSYQLSRNGSSEAVRDVANLIARSRRGIIVVGNVRPSNAEDESGNQLNTMQCISDFAKSIGFPIFAGVQSAQLRFTSTAVVSFAEHILKCPIVSENLKPDIIIQIGAPLVSTAISGIITNAMNEGSRSAHVLVHPHLASERADPDYTVTHKISAEVVPFLNQVYKWMNEDGSLCRSSSQLASLVLLGRSLRTNMCDIIREAAELVQDAKQKETVLTEPEIVMAIANSFSHADEIRSLFLSNSMPIRDAESFFYPFIDRILPFSGPKNIGTNRGASGIDGVISSALGFAESTEAPTVLLIGDLATLHDIGSLHSIADTSLHLNQAPNKKRPPLSIVIVNNDGGGIFSFLPIKNHGKDVAFEEFFGTPTSTFSFKDGSRAFGIETITARNYSSFTSFFEMARQSDTIIEAQVIDRGANVLVHQKISEGVEHYVTDLLLTRKVTLEGSSQLPIKFHSNGENTEQDSARTMILMHGWMGEKTDWDSVAPVLLEKLGQKWIVASIDLPGHGTSALQRSSTSQVLQSALNLQIEDDDQSIENGIDRVAKSILNFLSTNQRIKKIDALVGYSAGGRIALAMKRLCATEHLSLVDDDIALILLGSYPGDVTNHDERSILDDNMKKSRDEDLASEILSRCDKLCLTESPDVAKLLWGGFLERWYGHQMWGKLKIKKSEYSRMINRRSHALTRRGRDLGVFLSECSPPKNNKQDWKLCSNETALFMAGELDLKYKEVGCILRQQGKMKFSEIKGAGHALLTEEPRIVAETIADFLQLGITSSESTVYATSSSDLTKETKLEIKQQATAPLWTTSVDSSNLIDSLEFDEFSVEVLDGDRSGKPVVGIGWGNDASAKGSEKLTTRAGFIIQLKCTSGLDVGLGEVSPLFGLHKESLKQAKEQLIHVRTALQNATKDNLPEFKAGQIVTLDGHLTKVLEDVASCAGLEKILPSVYSGLEMALIALASQKLGLPVHQALTMQSNRGRKSIPKFLALSGLITRTTPLNRMSIQSYSSQRCFASWKVKVGHQSLNEDMKSMLRGFQRAELHSGRMERRIRADANRSWNENQAIQFAMALEGIDVHSSEKLEFIEEPLVQVLDQDGKWSFPMQIDALERMYFRTGISYALDESLADVVEENDHQYDSIKEVLETVFANGSRGCAAFVLKPTLIGTELSAQIARLARSELNIGAVFSSSFDSGLALAYTSFLGYLSDQVDSRAETYPHGVGTFSMLGNDTLAPPFSSYVNNDGQLNIPSLSRALYGLSLEELRDAKDSDVALKLRPMKERSLVESPSGDAYEASTATSSSGKEISVAVSLPLPFSAETACSRFTDLPSMSRWSPWISSVEYDGIETEWSINVRGIPLKWRATSEVINEPFPGIQWQSVSGVKNQVRDNLLLALHGFASNRFYVFAGKGLCRICS
jgi:2-succinyl-5-enolpyruvyl-6-hydroxy-3-cyclohexene-1-carboxylate synthase